MSKVDPFGDRSTAFPKVLPETLVERLLKRPAENEESAVRFETKEVFPKSFFLFFWKSLLVELSFFSLW